MEEDSKDVSAIQMILDLREINVDHQWADLKRREYEFEESIDREKLKHQLSIRIKGGIITGFETNG